jgi:acid stress-induced BolA-like protein IbaG/YrbA
MSDHPTTFQGDVLAALRTAVEEKVPGARAEVNGGGGHYTLVVTSASFEGKSTLERQRMVYTAIAHLMKGDMAPVHAIDSMKTVVP